MAKDYSPSARAMAFKAWMSKRDTNTKQVSEQAGVSYTTLASFVQGHTQSLRGDTEARLTAAFDCSADEMFANNEARRTVPLVGYVGAGAFLFANPGDPIGEVDAPDNATETTVAAEIRGDSLGALFNTWLVYYDEVQRPVTPDLIGRLCVVGLPDGRILVKKIRKAKTPDLYHLESATEETLTDEEISWAARVKSMTPR